jgi:sodium/hydrogen exchanger 8
MERDPEGVWRRGDEAHPGEGFGASTQSGQARRAADEAVQHEFASLTVVVVVVVIALSIGFAYLAKRFRFYYLPESAFTMLAGTLVGLVVMLALKGEETMLESLRFQPELFFFVLLPPIIFEAGYTLRRKRFFRNLSTILSFAVLGTIISTFVIGFIIYGFARADVIPFVDKSSPLQSLLFGALISAVDPVATLSIMGSPDLNCDKTLYSLVFGESVLNDAVAIVLFKTFANLAGKEHANMHLVGSYIMLILEFLGISIGSVFVGAACGLGAAYLFKHTQLRRYPSKEIVLLFLTAYFAYAVGEAIGLSGVMALFFCGIVLAHYNVHNLSPDSQETAHVTFKAFATITETTVFAYMGIAPWVGHFADWSGAFISLGVLACLLARACNTFPLSWLANTRRKVKIPLKMQFVIWFAGLRGAIAFALSLNMPTPANGTWNNDIIVTTTLSIVVFTTFVAGGLTEPMLSCMGMREGEVTHGEDQPETSAAAELADPAAKDSHTERTYGGMHLFWKRLDENYLKPVFGGEPTSVRTPAHREQTALVYDSHILTSADIAAAAATGVGGAGYGTDKAVGRGGGGAGGAVISGTVHSSASTSAYNSVEMTEEAPQRNALPRGARAVQGDDSSEDEEAGQGKGAAETRAAAEPTASGAGTGGKPAKKAKKARKARERPEKATTQAASSDSDAE